MIINFHKSVSDLPDPLEPSAVYAVRSGEGFDLYISDALGLVAHRVNGSSDGQVAQPVQSIQTDDERIYYARNASTGNGYTVTRRLLSSGDVDGVAGGSLPIPDDLTILTYV